MTLIVGLIHEDEVWMGSDSYNECGHVVYHRAEPKIFFLNEPESERRILIGAAGDGILGQLAHFNIELPIRQPEWDAGQYIVQGLCEALADAINAHCDKIREKKWPDGLFLLAYDGQLFSADRKMYVLREDEGIIAIGWGDETAMGALEATSDLPPKERLERALLAASKRTSKVAPPFHIEKL
jgi:ATP-dependent protease HslVU (ClpYQ) peptidase subunit